MKEDEEDKSSGLLANEKIANSSEKIDTKKLEASNDGDDFKGYSNSEKYKLFGLFFSIGIINHLGTILVMTGGRLLAKELKMDDYVTVYISASIIFALITRIVNSKLFVKLSYKKRINFLCYWMVAGYFLMFLVLLLNDTVLSNSNGLCFALSFIPCFLLGSSYAFGESAMLGYLRLFPKTLLGGWSSGTGISGFFGSLLNFLSQLNDWFNLKYLYLILVIVGPLYLYLFNLTIKIYQMNALMSGDENKNPTMELSPIEGDTIEPEGKNENIAKGYENQRNEDINKKEENKEFENINEENKTINFENFLYVMRTSGKIIGNLGAIYFLLFFCFNGLVVRVCSKVNISFLPKDSNGEGKGQYEFIALFFQIGMFISKTFIKLIRRISPIEIYTIVIFVINIIFIIEYYTGFLKWGNYIIFCLILGFFGGGTYAGGFYSILNSDEIQENYKELTINIATLFNDLGTFLSGIFGLIALKYWFNSTAKFS